MTDPVLPRSEGDAVRAVVLTGVGKAFCAGKDLKERREAVDAFVAKREPSCTGR